MKYIGKGGQTQTAKQFTKDMRRPWTAKEKRLSRERIEAELQEIEEEIGFTAHQIRRGKAGDTEKTARWFILNSLINPPRPSQPK